MQFFLFADFRKNHEFESLIEVLIVFEFEFELYQLTERSDVTKVRGVFQYSSKAANILPPMPLQGSASRISSSEGAVRLPWAGAVGLRPSGAPASLA